jgi:monofunctional glycosyltransferase
VIATLIFVTSFLLWFIPPVYKLQEGPIMQTRWLRLYSQTNVLIGPDELSWVSLEKTSQHLINAIISAEDSRFFAHHGVDLREVVRSIKLNFSKGRYARGGSTITQQVVKLSFLSSDKTIVRKLREITGALILETLLSKDEILAWYLNLADFGSGTYGVKDAADYYFSSTPDRLTVAESIHLALVLPAPNTWSKGLKSKLLTEFGRRRFKNVLGELLNNKYITKQQYDITLQTGNFGRPITSVMTEQ